MRGNRTVQSLSNDSFKPSFFRNGFSIEARSPKVHPAGDFRPDINGLRAIAVLSVVLFHFGVPGVQGGYVGVDVFFVISGYLMTRIIWSGCDEGRFSLVAFIWGRLSRVVPALLTMTIFVLGVGAVISLPNEWMITARQAVWSTFFAVNILFVREVSYFLPLAANRWFLHCWSLAVEFQFYVFYSILIFALRAILPSRYSPAVLAGLAALSLIYCVIETKVNASEAFYMMPARFWEFAAGGSVMFLPKLGSGRLRSATSWISLATLVCVACFFAADLVYPGLWPILPVAGTVAVIWADTPNVLLANPIVQFLGTISYSLYLWHWPLSLTFRYFGYPESANNIIVLFAITLAASYFSYRLVEASSRAKLKLIGVPTIMGLVGSMLAVLGLCTWIQNTQGFPGRLDDATLELVEKAVYSNDWREGQCFLRPEQSFSQFGTACLGGKTEGGRPKLLLWGDSHAAQLYPGLVSRPWSADYDVEQLTASACSPVPAVPSTARPHCPSIQRDILATALDQKPDIVLMSAAWFSWGHMTLSRPVDRLIATSVGISRLVHTLRAGGIKRVVVLGPIPQWDLSLPQVYFRERFRTGVQFPKYIRPVQDPELAALTDAVLATAVSKSGGDYVSVFDKMCETDGCRSDVGTATGPALMEFDGEHVTRAGSDWLANAVIGPALGKVVSIQPELAPESVLKFDLAGQGPQYLASGWRSPEPWGTWSLTTRAGAVMLPVRTWTPKSLDITFSGQLGGAFSIEHFGLQIDGDEPVQLTVTKEHPVASASIQLGPRARAKAAESGFVTFRVTATDGESPTEMGQNADDRKLGFGLRELKLQ